jgi:hypothetical protein
LTLGLSGAALSHEGESPYGEWRSSGNDEFSQGLLENLQIDSSSEDLILGRSRQGVYLPAGGFTSSFFETKVPFDSVMIGYSAEIAEESDLTVHIRALGGPGGSKTRWHQVQSEDDRVFEKGPFRFLQYRISMRTSQPEHSPRFHFLSAVFARQASAHPQLKPLGTGNGNVPRPEIVSRSDWGAKPPKKPYGRHTPVYLVVHHTGVPDFSSYVGAASIRGIQNFHQNGRGWNDIGYHFLIGPEGTIYQGRPEGVVGAHATPNTGKVGISLIGNFQDEGKDDLTPATRRSLVQLMAWLAGSYSIDPGTHIQGHRDWNQTNCPGQRVYDQLDQLRSDVAKTLADADSGDPVVPDPPGTGHDSEDGVGGSEATR